MELQIKLFNLLAITSVLLVSCQKNNDDEGRPYEFGFTIDGQQHRHEKKDTKGIIQGEFGFITADGIYHVTVYATDENGNFKILSMRNVRISAPLDGSPLPPGAKIESVPGVSVPQQPQSPQPPLQPAVSVNNQEAPRPLPLSYPNQVRQQDISTTSRPNGRYMFTTQPTIKPACGGCGYVTTAKPKPGEPKFTFQTPQFQEKLTNQQNYPETPNVNIQNNNGNPPAPFVSSINSGLTSDGLNPSGPLGNSANSGLSNKGEPAPVFSDNPSISGLNNRAGSIGSGGNPTLTGTPVNSEISKTNNEIVANPLSIQSPKIPLNQPENSPPSRLSQVTVSDGAIHVPDQDDIKIRDKFPGMVDGLPAGVKEKDITDLLYQFHYEVGFHGHYEKGTKSGAKIGGYFVNGRDGISRVVTYVADENGFQPKVKFIRLGLDSPDTPKADTEKTFGLKSFEFIWYPVD